MRVIMPLLLLCLTAVYQFGYGQNSVQFDSDTTEGCAPLTIHFEDLSNFTGKRYRWSFGNGNYSYLQDPQAIYYQPGTYEVSLAVTDSNGVLVEEFKKNYITVFKGPDAGFSLDQRSGCFPFSVDMDEEVTIGDTTIRDWVWDFGDGNTTKDKDGLHSYNVAGRFNVSLLVVDHNNCEDQLIEPNYIEVTKTPEVDFRSNKQFYCTAPFDVTFEDRSRFVSGTDVYLWDFGDGSTSSLRNPSHTYTSKGAYNVTLTISNSKGCSKSKTYESFIEIGDLIPDFEANELVACVPSNIAFKNLTRPTTKGIQFRWEFGDGSATGGVNTWHKYSNSGKYDVKLTATVDSNCSESITKWEYVEMLDKPKADFSISDSTTCLKPVNLQMQNLSTNFLGLQWFLNGVSLGTGYSAGQYLTAYGDYEVRLVAWNFAGCNDTMTKWVKIQPLLIDLKADKKDGCRPLTVHFWNAHEPSDSIVEWEWDFGDSTVITSAYDTATHTFNTAGTYNVVLRGRSVSGCLVEDSWTISVGEKLNPSFALGSETVCNNVSIEYLNTTTPSGLSVDSISWQIGGQQFSTARNGVLGVDLDSGWYDITLIMFNRGCADTFVGVKQLYVNPPHAKMKISEAALCSLDPVILSDSSQGADSMSWLIYDTLSRLVEVDTQSVLRLDSNYNRFRVTLYTENFTSGCIDSIMVPIYFPESPTVADIYASGANCSPATYNFAANSPNSDHNYVWIIEGDTERQVNLQHTFYKPGVYDVKLLALHKYNPCKDSMTEHIQVVGPRVVGEVIAKEGCAPVEVELVNRSALTEFEKLYWLIGGDTIFVNNNIPIVDTLERPGQGDDGLHTLKLIGVDSNGCSDFQDFPVKVTGLMNSRIKIRRFSDCDRNRFIFQLVAPGYSVNTLDLDWSFSDGSIDSGALVNKIFPVTGAYDIELTITQPNGCVTVLREQVDIDKEKLDVRFDADSLETACPPLFVQFNNLSRSGSRPIASYYWDFGDSSYSIEANPSKLYLNAGRYSVKLYVRDEAGCEDSAVYKEFVIVEGPEGSYTFDKDEGCVPLTVIYKGKTKDAQYFEWDMGDGVVVENTDSFSHTYTHAGRFIPLLILSDTLGCSYTIPPIDTIYVDPYPIPAFTYAGKCFGDSIYFTALDSTSEIAIDSFLWEFTQGSQVDSFIGRQPVHVFDKEELPLVRLTVFSPLGCSNTLEKQIDLYGIKADIHPVQQFNCVGTEVSLEADVISDTSIRTLQWFWQGRDSIVEKLTIVPNDTGILNIKLLVTDEMGCQDTFQSQSVVIGDTLPPLDLEMLRVSVVDDQRIVIDHKVSRSIDFNAYKIYVQGPNGYELIAEEKDRKVNSFQHYGPNTLRSSYCYTVEIENTCGLMSDTLAHKPHCSIEVEATGRVNAIDLDWNHYSGWEALDHYEVWREQSGNFVWIADVDADATSYTDSTVRCHEMHRYKIRGVERNGNIQWSLSDSCAAEAQWVSTLPANELIRATVVDDEYISIDWDSVHYPRMPIAEYVIERALDGVDYHFMQSFGPAEFTTTDREVEVDDRSYFYRSYAVDVCGDTSPISNFGKTILLHASTDSTLDQRPILDWTTYHYWYEDVNYYTVELQEPDGSFTLVATTQALDTNQKDELTDLNQRAEYCYRITGHRNDRPGTVQVVSRSNVDCAPVRSLIWIPNAFSPNGDNINDKFVTPGVYIKEYHLLIYNRWGEKVFESNDYYNNWDGMYMGQPAQQDAYMVIVESLGVDGVKRRHAATVTLLR